MFKRQSSLEQVRMCWGPTRLHLISERDGQSVLGKWCYKTMKSTAFWKHERERLSKTFGGIPRKSCLGRERMLICVLEAFGGIWWKICLCIQKNPRSSRERTLSPGPLQTEFPGGSQWRRGEGVGAEASGGLHRVWVGRGAHEKLRLSPIPTPAVDQQPAPGASAFLSLSFLLWKEEVYTRQNASLHSPILSRQPRGLQSPYNAHGLYQDTRCKIHTGFQRRGTNKNVKHLINNFILMTCWQYFKYTVG